MTSHQSQERNMCVFRATLVVFFFLSIRRKHFQTNKTELQSGWQRKTQTSDTRCQRNKRHSQNHLDYFPVFVLLCGPVPKSMSFFWRNAKSNCRPAVFPIFLAPTISSVCVYTEHLSQARAIRRIPPTLTHQKELFEADRSIYSRNLFFLLFLTALPRTQLFI